MLVYLDFDQTVVSSKFPNIGSAVPGAIETVKQIMYNGHRVVLNTARIHFGINHLHKATSWLYEQGIDVHGHTSEKLIPAPYKLAIQNLKNIRKSVLNTDMVTFFIDDISEGVPTTIIDGFDCVDWSVIARDFLQLGIIKDYSLSQEKIQGMYRYKEKEKKEEVPDPEE